MVSLVSIKKTIGTCVTTISTEEGRGGGLIFQPPTLGEEDYTGFGTVHSAGGQVSNQY